MAVIKKLSELAIGVVIAIPISILVVHAIEEFVDAPFKDRIRVVEPEHHRLTSYGSSAAPLYGWSLNYIDRFFNSALIKARDEVRSAGVPWKMEADAQDIEEMVQQALPYIAHELGTDRVFVPYIQVFQGERSSQRQDPLGRYDLLTGKIEVDSTFATPSAKYLSIHETVHAQVMTYENALIRFLHRAAKFFWGGFSDSPFNESFAEVVTLEVLANQALDGDLLAKFMLFYNINASMRSYNDETYYGMSPDVRMHYQIVPVIAIFSSLISGNDSYEGVRLDGIKELIRREVELYQRSASQKEGKQMIGLELQHVLSLYPELDTPAYKASFMAQFGKP